VNRRNFLRTLLGVVAAPFVAKVATRQPTIFGLPVVEAAGESPGDEPLVLDSFDYYGPHRAPLALTKGEDGGIVATAGEWKPMVTAPEVVIDLDAKRHSVEYSIRRDVTPVMSWDGRFWVDGGAHGKIAFDVSAPVDMSALVPGASAVFLIHREGGVIRLSGNVDSVVINGGRTTCGISEVISVDRTDESPFDRLLADLDRVPERNVAMTRDLLSGLGSDAEQAIRDYAACFKGKA
jgi:hypothetical protein